ncbi:MAG: hypothetical protein JNK33_00510 [Candidatus Doudnabacteria bacterium]|nr:hypothetical protein [Candidatus Doudnabacteria bacterium]
MKRDTLVHFLKTHLHDHAHSLSAHSKAQLKSRILQNLRTTPMSHPEPTHRVWGFTYTRLAFATLSVVILLGGTAYTSSAATPGDVLYPIKRAMEDTRVKFASNPETKARLQVQFTEERLRELETVALKAPLKMKTTTAIQADPASVTPAATATGVIVGTVEPEPEREITPAENSAREEVDKALKKLEKTRDDLSKQGNVLAADNLAKTINLLNGRVSKKERENFDRKRDDGRVKGSARTSKEEDDAQAESDTRRDDADSFRRRPHKD